MSQRITLTHTIPAILFLLAVTVAALTPSPVAAQDACANQVDHGVLCDGPREIQASFLPLIQSSQDVADERDCPEPVGNGVLCSGPVIPESQPAPAVHFEDTTTAPDLFLPLISG